VRRCLSRCHELTDGGTFADPIVMTPVAHIVGGRTEPTDDYWGGTRSTIRIDLDAYTEASVAGLDEFFHLKSRSSST
jgi:hypothetical protein